MSVAVNDIIDEIDDQAKQDAWDQFRVVLPVRGGDHYNLVSTELADPILNTVWMVVKEQICLQAVEDYSNE
jgi:hypothetical protein